MTNKYKILNDYEHTLMLVEDVLGSKVTTNTQLDNLGFHLFGNDYLGTFPSDKMPKYAKDRNCFILNTDSSKSKNDSGHWVGFCKMNGKLYFYDSFARPAFRLSKFWANKRLINANKLCRDQSFKESDCGARILAWIIIFMKYGEKCIDII